MGFEIPLDSDYFDHPKALKMISLLGKTADVYPVRLWAWCAKYAKNGVIHGGQVEIENAVRWSGEAGKCHKAMMDAGVINKDGKTVHDWMHHAGRKIAAYEKKKERQRYKYESESASFLLADSSILPDSSGTQGGILPTPNETKRNETKRNETKRNGAPEISSEDFLTHLAQKATFDEGWGTDPKRMTIWRKHLADLFSSGKTLELIDSELEKSPDSEPPWDFFKRLNGGKTPGDSPESNADRRKRERELMEIEGRRQGIIP